MHEVIPPRSLKEKQRKEREDLILQVAEDVLLEKGYHEMSMDEIAARVGIAKGTLYLHFAKKDELVFMLLERDLQNLLDMVGHADTIEGDAKEKLSFILHSLYRGLLGKHLQLLYVLYNSAELKVAIRDRQTEVMKQVATHIRALLDEGKVAGMFDTTIPTDIMVNIFFSVLSPLAYKRLVVEQKMPVEDLVRYVQHIYFKGIAPDPSVP